MNEPPNNDRFEPPDLDDFIGEPTRDLRSWHWLWREDHGLPIRSHRKIFGRLLVAFKRLLRPFVKAPVNDLWDRQRSFNLILLDHLLALEEQRHESRIGHLENFVPKGLDDVLRHNDALFSRVDQKLDRYRREADDLSRSLGTALAVVSESAEADSVSSGSDQVESRPGPEAVQRLARAWEEQAYLALERQFRGSEDDIAERIRRYAPYLEGRGRVLDLGCGRGEALAVMAASGLDARGVDSSAEMVERCRERGLQAEEGDLFQALAAIEPGTLGGVVSFHVIEHLPGESLERLARLAFRALEPGGVLILETPNPLSIVVAARNFWIDPTHRRPIHPRSLRLFLNVAGFDQVEMLELRPFADADRLPEIDLDSLTDDQRLLADRVNRLRDRLDATLFGFQDYALVATKNAATDRPTSAD